MAKNDGPKIVWMVQNSIQNEMVKKQLSKHFRILDMSRSVKTVHAHF